MEYRGLRATKEQLKRMQSTKSITDVMKNHYKRKWGFSVLDEYYVHYKYVRTEDLIVMLQRLTIFNGFMGYLDFPSTESLERLSYLNIVEDYANIKVTEKEFSTIKEMVRNKNFVEKRDHFIKQLKLELATREHVPNKEDKKIIRKLKAQGRYIID